MSSLRDASVSELEAELTRRRGTAKVVVARPPLLPRPDFTKLVANVERTMVEIEEGEHPRDDHPQYVFEGVMTALYGDKFWPWWNQVRS